MSVPQLVVGQATRWPMISYAPPLSPATYPDPHIIPSPLMRSFDQPTPLSKVTLLAPSPLTRSLLVAHCVACSATEARVMLPGTRAAGLCKY
jgi:hypothetical protein